jgi:hypothetical protein
MAKPPKSTPHSDIGGIHQDEKRNTDTAEKLGQGAESLVRAQKETAARPDHSDEKGGKDDRTS